MGIKSTEEKKSTEAIFDRIGGADAVAAVVEMFYERVLADPTLAHFFDGVNMDWLHERQRQFITEALGGPKGYEGGSMSKAHTHLNIASHHFDQIVGHLARSLESGGVDSATIDQIAVVLGPLKSQIVTANSGEPDTGNEKGESTMGTATLDQTGVEQGRFRSMMENAPTNVVMADTDLKVIYANPASVRTLEQLKEYLPVPVEQVVGSNIDIFHKDPSYQRKILSDQKNLPVQAKIQIGPEIAYLLVRPIFDNDGTYLGTMLTWELVTAKVKLETEQARVQAMVENSPTNVVMADPDLNIIYANPASVKTLESLSEYLPVPVDKVIGSNIDIFHKDPAYQRRILSNPKNLPVKAQITIGPEIADLLVSPIYDTDGTTYLGPMLTWEVVTEKVKLETEQARIQSMVENSPTNVMMADPDLNIMYVNPASIKTLTQLAQYLPVSVDQVIGSSIDIFHKDPAYQRKILGDPKNLPVEANIVIGPETASLLVSAIYDNNGTYLGPMVTWSVITKQVTMETRVAETAQALASSSEQLTNISAQMSAGAEETSSQANVVSAAAEQVSKNVDTVATGAEELSASIKEISANTTEAAKVADEAVNVASSTTETMNKLDKSSAEIGQVIKVITSIAQQTNLLALNATIEAARAGEAGKGFAVVANEVKELAKETAKATEDIGQKIEAIQNDTRGAVDAISQISTIITQISDIQNTVAGAVEEQTVTTNEIGRNVAEAAKGSTEIAENISGVAKSAQDTAAGANDAKSAASDLSKMAQDLQALVDKADD